MIGSYDQLSSIQRRSASGIFFLQKNGGAGCHRGQDLVGLKLLWSSFPTKEWRKRLSLGTGPCWLEIALEFISYKRMEERDVTVDRLLCYGFLQKNGGQGCHAGHDLWIVYGRG